MAKQVAKSKLAGKINSAVETHKHDETKFDNAASLPAGIENGVAQLVECKFGTYEKGKLRGEFYFYAAGSVVRPKEHEGAPVSGLRTSIMEPICDTPGRSRESISDHVAWVLNEFRKLGVDTTNVTADTLEQVAEALKKSKPYFRFRTWKGAKQEIEKRGGKFYVGDKAYSTEAAAKAANPYVGTEPRTQEVWNGAIEDFALEDDDEVQDDTQELEDVEPQEDEEQDAETSNEDNDGNDDTSEDASAEDEDWAALGEAADNGDEDAKVALNAKALELGCCNPDDVETWAEVATSIIEALGGGETQEEEESAKPEKGDAVYYLPKGKRKAIECEVTAVFDASEKCNLKSLADGTLFKSVLWTELRADA